MPKALLFLPSCPFPLPSYLPTFLPFYLPALAYETSILGQFPYIHTMHNTHNVDLERNYETNSQDSNNGLPYIIDYGLEADRL